MCVPLLRPRDVPRQVFDRGGILARKAVGLRLGAGFVDQDSGIGGKAGEGEDGAFVYRYNFADCSRILEPATNNYMSTIERW